VEVVRELLISPLRRHFKRQRSAAQYEDLDRQQRHRPEAPQPGETVAIHSGRPYGRPPSGTWIIDV
jgi:hypothetical protein